jgi:DNA-directed RNA polymerase subunit RPC12/RpoP
VSPEAQNAQQYPCEQCGAELNFLPGSNSLKCPYCGFENTIAKSDVKIEELDYRAYLEQAAKEKDTHEAPRTRCEKCGAETTMPSNVTAGLCPFCGSPIVFSGKTTHLIRPEALLPFKVTQQDAFADFRIWINRLWFAPGDLKRYAQSEGKLVGIYIPCWTYDCETTSSYTGERGEHYYTTETDNSGRTVREQHTKWTPVSGNISNDFDDVLIIASHSLPKAYADRLQPWDLKNLVPYEDEYLSGFRAESYQVSLQQGFEEAKQIMDVLIRSAICRQIGGSEQRVTTLRTQYGKTTFKHILLPVWLSAYRYRDKVYRIVINARTGAVRGERPYSTWKIAIAVVIGILVVLWFLYLKVSSSG